MYKVKCHNRSSQYDETVILPDCDNDFMDKKDAQNQLLKYALDRLDITNIQSVVKRPFVFIPKSSYFHVNRTYDVAIFARFCSSPDEFMHGYYIEWVSEDEVDTWNRKLKDKYGETITLRLYSYPVGDDYVYYYEGATTDGESDTFDTIEEAYEEACKYMDSLFV